MTFQTALMTVGHYLLLAVGLILLLFILILAVAFLLTLFMRFFADISLKTVNGKILKSIRLRFKILFYEIDLLDIDDFDGGPESDSESAASGTDKNLYHVTVTDEKISVQTTESKKSGSDYEIIVRTEETVTKDIEISDGSQTVVLETPDIVFETEDITIYHNGEADGAGAEDETVTTVETVVTDYEFDAELSTSDDAGYESVDAVCDTLQESDEEQDEEDPDFDFSDSYDEIKRYVDLSDPGQFVSDSITAAVRISKASARFAGDLLLRTRIDNLSADVIYGLSDPANTALSFGAVHSFKASVYAYLADVAEKSRSAKKRRKAAEIGAILRDDIHIVPGMTEKTFEADADMSFSFWIPHLYIPGLRFLLNKDTRWVIRRYLYPYFIRHYIRTRKAERKQRKAAKKPDVSVSS